MMLSAAAKHPTRARSNGGLLIKHPLERGFYWQNVHYPMLHLLPGRHSCITRVCVPQRRPKPSHRLPLMAGGTHHGPCTTLIRPRNRCLSQRSVVFIIRPGASTSGASTPTFVLAAVCHTPSPTVRSSMAATDHLEPLLLRSCAQSSWPARYGASGGTALGSGAGVTTRRQSMQCPAGHVGTLH